MISLSLKQTKINTASCLKLMQNKLKNKNYLNPVDLKILVNDFKDKNLIIDDSSFERLLLCQSTTVCYLNNRQPKNYFLIKSNYFQEYDDLIYKEFLVFKRVGYTTNTVSFDDKDFAYITNINVGKSIKFTARIKISNSLQEKFRNYDLL